MRHQDRPGHPENPEHAVHPDGSVRDFAQEPVRDEDPAVRASGRHRRGGGARRRRPRRPTFRTAVTAAGAAAAVLTVATGVYVASSPAAGPTTATAPAAAVRAAAAAPSDGGRSAPPSEPGTSGSAPATTTSVRETGPSAPPTTATTPSPRTAGATPARPTLPGTRQETGPKAESERRREPRPEHSQEQGQGQGQGQGQEQGQGQPGLAPGAPLAEDRAERFVQEVVALANTEREKAGCGPLRSESHLRTAAQNHADDMSARDYYEHDNPEGDNAGDRMSGAGYTWSTWGENIHRGPKTPVRAMQDWMNSPGHRANILNCSFKDIGVGVTLTSNGPWWVQNFGVKR
ncbi:CAP domain-containing protein [Streptomyces sp. NPDC017254]|uniref:CAP domain-containing protein n=1 Tax=unclassified Streptomyces TaxID=2593676 RepID=UPI003798C123